MNMVDLDRAWSRLLVMGFLVVLAGGCVASECRDGSHAVGDVCVADDAAVAGTGGDSGMAGTGGTSGDDAGDNDAGRDDDGGGMPSTCNDGYARINGACEDIDECLTSNGGCSIEPMVACTNTPGSRTCAACPTGYTGDGITCMDIDECALNSDECDDETSAACANTPGTYHCVCPAGFEGDGLAPDGCANINECATDNGGCDTSPMIACTDTHGGRECGACPAGYAGTGVGAEGCTDINECLINNGGCDAAAACINTAGGRMCGECPDGYVGNGTIANGCTPHLLRLSTTPGLNRGFSTTVDSYSASVGPAARYIEVVAATLVANATITVDGAPLDAHGSRFVWLGEEEALIPVVLTDPHGRSSSYAIDVTRGSTLRQRSYVKSSEAGQYRGFGTRVATDGRYLAVSGYAPGLYGGEIRIFTRSGTSWTSHATIDGATVDGMVNAFGLVSLDLSGETLVVGEPNAPRPNGGNAGLVHVFVRVGTMWSLQATLRAHNAEDADKFGQSVAIHGDRIVVGAPGEDSNVEGNNIPDGSNNAISGCGAAYVFTRSGETWDQTAYLKAHDVSVGDAFGTSVDIYRDTILVGAPGEDSSGTGINPGVDNARLNSGAAYLFKYENGAWPRTTPVYIKASMTTAAAEAGFGQSLALGTEEHFVIGAPGTGEAYVFGRATPTQWAQQASLYSPTANDVFGYDVAMWGPGTVVVFAPGDDSTSTGINSTRANASDHDSGASYVFTRTGAESAAFAQSYYIKALNAEQGDGYVSGYVPSQGVSIVGDQIVMASIGEDSSSSGITIGGPTASNDIDDSAIYNAGAVYSFQ